MPSMQHCVHAGQYCARVIIQHTGCTFPENPSYDGYPLEVPTAPPAEPAEDPACKEAGDTKPADE